MPKTGSTWLQKKILPKMKSIDVCYKEELRKCMLSWSDKNILISYENYVGFPHVKETDIHQGWMDSRKRTLYNLSSFFPDADIVLIVRKQTELIRSLYNQYIKVGGSISFHEYISGKHPYSININALKYTELLNQIQQHFSGRILLINYNFLKNQVEDFGKAFLNFVGCTDQIDFKRQSLNQVNTSLTDAQIITMIKLNRIFHTYYSPNGYKFLKRSTYKKIRSLLMKSTNMFYGRKKYNIFHPDDLESIEKFFFEDWNRIQEISNKRFVIVDRPFF